ncbi:DUF2207 domain-containing protein [Clostridium scatologenes]|uniref:Membrane protein-like protein n=1 Tax=Clostridium scatologenes TaxID=1548 RepID=A0A0E3JZC2_CLOSL|nr:DUF2207 domain-containing protein [Clostridium scatologenes]AKA69637.1 membrane protein-like protein [Clostridium scatologenes]
MRKLSKVLFTFMLSLALLISFSITAEAAEKSYSYDKLDVDITLQEDGSALFTEHWIGTFKGGTFSRFKRNIPLKGTHSISDFSVSVDDEEYKQIDNFDANRPKGEFAISKDNNGLSAEVYFSAKDESKNFKFSYKVNNAVSLHKDTAEFYWKVLGEEVDIPIKNVIAKVHIPKGASKEEIKVWAHGPLNGNVTKDSGEMVSLAVDKVSPNTYVEIRTTAPLSLFPKGKNFTGKDALKEILAEEQQNADKANEEREANKKDNQRFLFWNIIFPIPVLIGGFIFIKKLKKKNFKRLQPALKPDYIRDLPSKLTPAEVTDLFYFYKKTDVYSQKFTSTILDLSLKGFLEFKPHKEERKTLIKIEKNKDIPILCDHEKIIFKFISKNVAGHNNCIGNSEIKTYIDNNTEEAKAIFDEFNEKSMASLEQEDFIDTTEKKLPKQIKILRAILILGIIITFYETNVLLAGAFVILFILSITGCSLEKLTQKGENELAMWGAFKNFLKDFTLFDEKELPELVVWERYLVYAVALGEGDTILKALPMKYPELQRDDYYDTYNSDYYILYMMCNMANETNNEDSDIFDSIRKLESSSNESSGSGDGGGFSSGGGSGDGGGGSSCD